MFGKVLNSHQEIICKNEILNHLREETLEKKVDYLNQYFSGNTLRDENALEDKTIGGMINPFKYQLSPYSLRGIVYNHSQSKMGSWITKNVIRKEPEIRVILLLRKNILKQAISTYIVKQEGTYHSTRTKFQNKDLLQSQEFDLEKLSEEVSFLQQLSKRSTKFTRDTTNEYLPILYEDIYQNPEETYKKVFDYIGVSNVQKDFDFTGGYKKVLSDDIKDIISNFDDIYKYPLLKEYL
ncbi:MAG: hypothetical protein WBB01_22120 [Phormidesmis sp.]